MTIRLICLTFIDDLNPAVRQEADALLGGATYRICPGDRKRSKVSDGIGIIRIGVRKMGLLCNRKGKGFVWMK